MSVLANLVVKMSADTSSLERGLKGAKGHMSKLSGVMKAGAVAGGAALVGLGVASLKMGMDFEKMMAEVKTLMPDISEEAFGAMKDDLLDFSKEMGIATDKAIPALYQAISAGVPKENVMEFMTVASKAAIGGVTELETAVDGITSVINAYGVQNISAAKAADIMFTGVKLGKTTFDELSQSLFNVVPIAAASGVSFEQVTAALAALTAQGVPTTVASTQLRAAIQALSAPTIRQEKLMKELGLSFSAARLEEIGLSAAMKEAVEATGGNMAQLRKLIGSVEGVQAVLALAGEQSYKFDDALNAMGESAGAVDAAFNTMEETTSRKLTKAINTIKVEMTRLGARVLPLLVKAFEEGGRVLQEWWQKHGPRVEEMLGDLVEGIQATYGAGKALFDYLRQNEAGIIAIIVAIGVAIVVAFGPGSAAVIAIGYLIIKVGEMRQAWKDAEGDWKQFLATGVKSVSLFSHVEDAVDDTAVAIESVGSEAERMTRKMRESRPAVESLDDEIARLTRNFLDAGGAADDYGASIDGAGGAAGGAAGELAQAVDIVTPGMAALNREVEREEVLVVNIAKALMTATTQHDMITEAITTTEKALDDATQAMSDWENAVLKGTRAFSDLAFGISQDMDRLQLKINEVLLGALEEGLEGGGYASDALTRKIRALADALGIDFLGGKADWDDIQKVLDAAGDAMSILRLESANVNLKENLSLGPAQRELDQFFEDQAGYAEETLPAIKEGWLKAKDEVDKHVSALGDYNNALIVNEIHMTFLQGLLDNHRAYLTDIRDLYIDIERAAQDAWSAAAQLPAGTAVTPSLPVPVYQQGGYVPKTGLALLHAGETVLPVSGGSSQTTVVFAGPLLGDRRQLEDLARRLDPYLQRRIR